MTDPQVRADLDGMEQRSAVILAYGILGGGAIGLMAAIGYRELGVPGLVAAVLVTALLTWVALLR